MTLYKLFYVQFCDSSDQCENTGQFEKDSFTNSLRDSFL